MGKLKKFFKDINSNTLVLMGVIVFAKLLGMMREVVLANYYGTSGVSDAYLIASSVPTLLFYFIGHALSTSFLPMYNKVKENKGEEEANRYANNLLTISLLICTVIVLALLLFPGAVVKLFATGFDKDTAALAAGMIRICAVSLYFMTVVSVWGGYLHAKNNFIIPAIISVPRNLVIITSIVLAATVHISALGIGLVAAYVAEFMLLLPFVLGNRFKPRFIFDFKSPELKETLYIVLPIMLGVSISQINKIVDKSIASGVVEGGISALTYASVINNAVQEIIVTGIITILFAHCAAWVAKGEHEIVKKKTSDTIITMLTLLIPASLGVIFLSRQLVTCFLARGNFDARSIQMTMGALCYYTLGLCFLAVRDTLIKVFYAYKLTKEATALSILAIFLGVVLKLVLSKIWGINGLAISTSFSALFHCITLYIVLRRHIGAFGGRQQLGVAIKALIASAAMIAVLIPMAKFLQNQSDLIQVLVMASCGAMAYFLIALILQVPLAKLIYNKTLGRLIKH